MPKFYLYKWQAIVKLFLLSAPILQQLQAQEDKHHPSETLRNDSITLLDAINVEAYQVRGRLRSLPGSLSVLTGESMVHADGTNLASALNTLPGASITANHGITTRDYPGTPMQE